MAKRTSRKPAAIRRETARAAQFASVYANDIQVQTTPWDMRFTFGEVSETPNEQRSSLLVTQLAEVRMSPQLAKKLVQIISAQLDSYERTFGTVPCPAQEGD